jgi:hypothetical protein
MKRGSPRRNSRSRNYGLALSVQAYNFAGLCRSGLLLRGSRCVHPRSRRVFPDKRFARSASFYLCQRWLVPTHRSFQRLEQSQPPNAQDLNLDHWTVTELEVLSITVPPMRVVEVTLYVPMHVFFGTVNGKETLFDVPGGIVNTGVVNITVLVLLQALGARGPVSTNFTLRVCGLLVHEMMFPDTVILPPS